MKKSLAEAEFALEKHEEKIYCEICNTEMYEKHCRIICPNCGFMWDCSDH